MGYAWAGCNKGKGFDVVVSMRVWRVHAEDVTISSSKRGPRDLH